MYHYCRQNNVPLLLLLSIDFKTRPLRDFGQNHLISSGGGGHCHCSFLTFVAWVPLNKNPYIVCTITPGHVHVSKSHRHKQPFILRSLTLWNPFSRIQPQHLSSSYNSGSLFASVADLEIESIRFLVTSSSELNADVLVILKSALVFVPNTVLNKLRVR